MQKRCLSAARAILSTCQPHQNLFGGQEHLLIHGSALTLEAVEIGRQLSNAVASLGGLSFKMDLQLVYLQLHLA
jgi:hypothetical protein